jgi:ADP-heptose:LPS heptosyltransferase
MKVRILITRTDRLGDVILSTPVLEALKRHYPDSEITFLVRSPIAPLLEGSPFLHEVLTYEPDRRHRGLGGFFRLMEELKSRTFDVSVSLVSDLRVSAAIFGVGVPVRIGPWSKPHSWLFYNRGLRQRRSHVEMHEVDYNLQLLQRLGIRRGMRKIATRVDVAQAELDWAKVWLETRGVQGVGVRDSRPLIVIHPGMGGSALNWPESHYVELAKILLERDFQVLVTAGRDEEELLGRLEQVFQASERKPLFYGGLAAEGIEKLAALFSFAKVVVAPSTGPLHLAVALRKPVVTFYSPVRVQSAIRWGPYLPNLGRNGSPEGTPWLEPQEWGASILVPDVYCGEDFQCRGTLCNYYLCMKGLTVKQALAEIYRQIEYTSHDNQSSAIDTTLGS